MWVDLCAVCNYRHVWNIRNTAAGIPTDEESEADRQQEQHSHLPARRPLSHPDTPRMLYLSLTWTLSGSPGRALGQVS